MTQLPEPATPRTLGTGDYVPANSTATHITFGPRLPEFGSWQWIGEALSGAIGETHNVSIFEAEVPACDIAVFIKFLPPLETLRILAKQCRIVFCPVDAFGSCDEIDAAWESLRLCSHVIVHSRSLEQYFSSYCPTTYLDHHLRFAGELREEQPSSGPIVWVGVHSNVPPFVDWANRTQLPTPLVVLTNRPDTKPFTASGLGFSSLNDVTVEEWSGSAHLSRVRTARLAIDIKGDDFRARHKPPAKALDFLASGIPLAMNPDSSPVRHIRRLGFEVVAPEDTATWLSEDYAAETRRFAMHLRGELGLRTIAARFVDIINDVLAERQR